MMRASASQTAVIQKVIVPASASSHYVDIRIDEFLDTTSIHRDLGMAGEAGETAEDRQARLVAAVRADLAGEVPVSLRMAGGRSGTSKESDSKYACIFTA